MLDFKHVTVVKVAFEKIFNFQQPLLCIIGMENAFNIVII